MPLQQTFWAARFGMLVDRFGIPWMVNCEGSVKYEQRTSTGGHPEGRVRPDVGRQARKWDVGGPHFAGWEIYHLKGSPADPNRLYASQSSGWFGQ